MSNQTRDNQSSQDQRQMAEDQKHNPFETKLNDALIGNGGDGAKIPIPSVQQISRHDVVIGATSQANIASYLQKKRGDK